MRVMIMSYKTRASVTDAKTSSTQGKRVKRIRKAKERNEEEREEGECTDSGEEEELEQEEEEEEELKNEEAAEECIDREGRVQHHLWLVMTYFSLKDAVAAALTMGFCMCFYMWV